MKIQIVIAFIVLLAAANFTFAQTTEFTYQGKLVDGSLPADKMSIAVATPAQIRLPN